MTKIELSSEITVKLVRSCASDDSVVQAAQVSAKGENTPHTVPERLIEALMKGRHGSPFEHNMFTFYVEAPIFVFREWHRHRIASINEWSGRYSEMLPKFYVPDVDRKVVNRGTKMKPIFGDPEDDETTSKELYYNALYYGFENNSHDSWSRYQTMLDHNVAPEVARMVLPVNTYSKMYWTVNARSLMNFLSLRVESDASLVRSYPQKEIEMGADQIELFFARAMPITHGMFIKNGRVAP